MSGTDSDFGGFDAPVSTRSKPIAPNTSKPNSNRAQAGPSKTVGSGTANAARRKAVTVDGSGDEDRQQPPTKKGKTIRGRKQQEREEEFEEDEGAGVVEEDADDVEEINPSHHKPKARNGSKPTSTVPAPSNGNPTNNALASGATKGKGKARAKASSKPRAQDVDEMEVEVVELADDPMEVEVENTARINPAPVKSERTAARATKNGNHQSSAKYDEVVQLKEHLAQANAHILDLTRQLDELLQVRQTEPERLLERMEAQYQAQIRVQDGLVEDLKAKLAQSDPLLRSGKTAVFELLTREEANKETEKLQQQLKSYREVIHERTQQIKEKDDRIATLEQEKKDLQYELRMEIDRGKALAAKNQRQPPSASRTNAGSIISANQDPKLAEIIKFYEDLTNVIIPSIKTQPGRFPNLSEWTLNCCYTYKDVTDQDAKPKSLLFFIRLCHDLKPGFSEPVEDVKQLVESVHYIPKELDKETAEFVESLGFLNDTFTFERDQLSLFLRTLHDNISGEGNDSNSKGEQEDDSDESVVLIQ